PTTAVSGAALNSPCADTETVGTFGPVIWATPTLTAAHISATMNVVFRRGPPLPAYRAVPCPLFPVPFSASLAHGPDDRRRGRIRRRPRRRTDPHPAA